MNFTKLLFSITEEKQHKVLTILGIKIKFSRATDILLKKYSYIPDLAAQEINNITQCDGDIITDNKYTMWLQDDIPEIIQMCIKSIQKFYPDIIVLTEKNLFKYVEIPDYIQKKYEDGIISRPHYSDYVRTVLLDKNGGTWIDSSCLMCLPIPKFILKQPFFILQVPKQTFVSNFFIHSVKNHLLIKTMRIFLEEYWKKENKAINYAFYHHYFYQICIKNKKCNEEYRKIIPYVNSKIRYLTDNIAKDADRDCWEYLSKTSFIYKINRKDKGIAKNPNCWYYFLLAEYRNNNLLKQIIQNNK